MGSYHLDMTVNWCSHLICKKKTTDDIPVECLHVECYVICIHIENDIYSAMGSIIPSERKIKGQTGKQ